MLVSGRTPKHYKTLDGLRAIAIVMVFGFHLHIAWFDGGYLGVDLFFVLSGFIVTKVTLERWKRTSIAKTHLESHKLSTDIEKVTRDNGIQSEILLEPFNWQDFFLRRIKRLWPEVYLMMLVTLISSHWVLREGERGRPFISALSHIPLASNFRFWAEPDGYFALYVRDKPLLHTWSLSVEEQFYIAFAIVLRVFGSKLTSQKNKSYVLVLLFITSAASSVVLIGKHKSLVFYLLPFRIWQMLAGVISATIFLNRNAYRQSIDSNPMEDIMSGSFKDMKRRNFVEMSLICLIAVIFIKPNMFGPIPALPLAVAVAILIYMLVEVEESGAETLIQRALSLTPLGWIGELSYSIYLWHWPIICYASKIFIYPEEPQCLAGIIALTAILAFLSHHGLTKRIRSVPNSKILQSRSIITFSISPILLFTFYCFIGALLSNHARFGKIPANDMVLDPCRNCGSPMGNCSASNDHVIVLGDSNAFMFAQAMETIAFERKICLHLFTAGSCVPFINNFFPEGMKNKPMRTCMELINRGAQYAKKLPQKVRSTILMASWELYMSLLVLDLHNAWASGMSVRERLYSQVDEKSKIIFMSNLSKTIETFQNYTEKLIVVSAMPSYHRDGWKLHCPAEESGCIDEAESKPENVVAYLTRTLINRTVSKYGPKVRMEDLTPEFCSLSSCSPYKNGTLIYLNVNHLSVYGARQLRGFLTKLM